MKIVQRLTVMMLLPAVGSGGRWNGGAGVLDDRDADRGGIHESMRTLPELLDGTIHDTDHGPRQGFASDQEAVASPSSSSSSATLTVGRLLRGGLTFVDALPVDRSTAAKDAKMQAIEDGARRGLFSLTGDATEDTLVWDPDADGGQGGYTEESENNQDSTPDYDEQQGGNDGNGGTGKGGTYQGKGKGGTYQGKGKGGGGGNYQGKGTGGNYESNGKGKGATTYTGKGKGGSGTGGD